MAARCYAGPATIGSTRGHVCARIGLVFGPLQAKNRRPFEAQDKQDRRTPNAYQINFSANCSWRLLAAVVLMVLNSPKVGAVVPT